MDRVVDTQLWLYNTSLETFRNFCSLYLVQANYVVFKCHFMCRDGSQVRGLKATWSGKLSDSHTTAIYVYYRSERGKLYRC